MARYRAFDVDGMEFPGLWEVLRRFGREAADQPRRRASRPLYGLVAEGPHAGRREHLGTVETARGRVGLVGVEPAE
ncbi:hypothetical protein [Paludisphaera mucosa]|uniref:Uncharacterized protein n=1 Tax=Paludisphaera mucosa TaxID=3030827 RepID=A0ABT6F778_9BACT|nr:hypothetical protein [Paludisphaera mucosa]MDG3003268.1 hypothetical protein [Paludisphaera mucosa]